MFLGEAGRSCHFRLDVLRQSVLRRPILLYDTNASEKLHFILLKKKQGKKQVGEHFFVGGGGEGPPAFLRLKGHGR